MARRRANVPLNVFVNGWCVGVLRRQASGAIDFTYADDWLSIPVSFPISLSLPLRAERYIGAPVMAVFDNLLPDSLIIRKQVAERVGATGTDPYSLLAALGHDCVGALQFLTDGVDPGPAGTTDGDFIADDEVADIIANLATAPLGVGADEAFRISIAGAQEKTALLRHQGRWFKPLGTTATTHILKPQIDRLPNGIDLSSSVENEYLCLKLLAALGVPVASAEIATFGDRRTLVVERFDRLWTEDGRLLRVPQEDCCQALSVPSTLKYQAEGGPGMRDIIGLLKGADSPDSDIVTFLRACIVFWLLGATDGHAKNFSIFVRPSGRYGLTPLYDVISAQPSRDARQIERKAFKLAMSVGNSRHYAVDEIVPRHFVQTAAAGGIGASIIKKIFDELAAEAVREATAVVDALPEGFPEPLAASVTGGIARRARLLEGANLDP